MEAKKQRDSSSSSSSSSNRRSKETSHNFKRIDSNEKLKKPHRVIQKSLSSVFGFVPENIMLETKEMVDTSAESEVACSLETKVDASPVSEQKNYEMSSVTTLLGLSEDAFGPSASSSSASKVISDDPELGHVADKVFVDFLRRQILNASDAVKNSLHEKLLDAFLNFILIEDELPTKTDCFSELVSAKMRIALFCFFAWIILVSIHLFSKSGAVTTLPDPPPT